MRSPRFLRGVAIARLGRVRQLRDDVWSVPSQSHKGSYLVDCAGARPACTCPDYEDNGNMEDFACKHIAAVRIASGDIEIPDDVAEQPAKRQTYKQAWPAYDLAQQHEREHVETLLRDLCSGIKQPEYKHGRPRKPLADVVYACALRAYVGMSSRRAASDVRAAQSAGMIDATVSPRTMLRYLDDPSLTDLLRVLIRESAAPLASVESTFAIDSSGFSTCTYARWFDHKWGKERKRQNWLTAHIIVGTSTHVITDALVTTGNAGDAPQLPELLDNTAERFDVENFCADKAYLSHRNFDAIEKVGAVPYIPFKVGTTGEGSALWRKMFGLFTYKNEDFRRVYHARSNVETVFSMIKRKHGAALRAKKFTAQRNELLVKLLVHNLCVLTMAMYELGVAVEFWGSTHGGHRVH